jgi:hypothetical protein
MAVTPLYKALKSNGTSFYAFPGAAEDISAAYQNENYRMYFSKFVLLNFPKQNLNPGTMSNPVQWDFENSFVKSNLSVASDYADQLVESLRNYVANHEVTIRDSKLNNTEFFYDNNQLSTTTEKIFWKWCTKLNVLDLERAVPGDEYFDNLQEFEANNIADDTYFPEILWREREVIDFRPVYFYQTGYGTYSLGQFLEIEFQGSTNFRDGDKIVFSDISNSSLIVDGVYDGFQVDILKVLPAGATAGDKIIVDLVYTSSTEIETIGTAKIVYSRLVQYIGEVNGINNVQEANRSYTEVYAHIPDHTGKTPDILFRTKVDVNYKPNMIYPILPSQFQPEIIGAENFNSPIVNTPQNYPGDFYGQFDTDDFTYETSSGDSLRRSGDYFGVQGDLNAPIYSPSTLDGLCVDFDRTHYVKMNVIDRELNTFDEFNALSVNGQPPEDFEFNAILWYYTVEDAVKGGITTNMYGITFLNHPKQNVAYEDDKPLVRIKLPSYKKLVANDGQDGTSYAFSLNLNFNIINDNPQDTYNPTAINSLFSMNLFNEAMKRLAESNDSFMKLNANYTGVVEDIDGLRGLLYTQTDFATINSRMSFLESLLNAYQSMQLQSSDTIEVQTNLSTSPPLVQLMSKDATYYKIEKVNTTDLYNTSGIIPLNINVPTNKNFLVNIINNDQTQFTLASNTRLTVVLDRDLDYRQSVDIVITADDFATQNKELDIYIKFYDGSPNGLPVETPLITKVNLPVFYNQSTQDLSISKKWDQTIIYPVLDDVARPILINSDVTMDIPVSVANLSNMVKAGDTFLVNNLIIDPISPTDYSGQYVVKAVSSTMSTSTIKLDISDKVELVQYGISTSQITGYPVEIHGTSSALASMPSLTFNKGVKYRVTRVDQFDASSLSARYLIEKILN